MLITLPPPSFCRSLNRSADLLLSDENRRFISSVAALYSREVPKVLVCDVLTWISTSRSGANELSSPMADWIVRLVSVANTFTQLCGRSPFGQGWSFKYRSSSAVPRRWCCLKPHSVSCPESARSLEWVGACFFNCHTGTPGLPASSESAASVPRSVSAVTCAFSLSTWCAVTPHWAIVCVLVSSANRRTHSSACITDRSP
mmetsp:Transcript_33304/g.86376  ORF Transcript_33304/g.86376 Transcript_33304/m.86376 type:complete len:201 (-) Transcript_33304:407-1009(-)